MKYAFFCLYLLLINKALSQVMIQSGASFNTTNGIVVTLKDIDLKSDGTLNQSKGTGKFVFSGVGNNTISGSTSPQFDSLEIAKTVSGKLILAQDVSIGSTVNFVSGNIDLANSGLLLQPSAYLKNESSTSRLTASGSGYVTITTPMNAPSGINPGNLGAVISSTQNLGNTLIRRGFASVPVPGGSILRYYDIVPANNSALNAVLRINYFDAELNGLNKKNLSVFKSTDNINFTNQGYTARVPTSDYVELNGISDFSRWTLAAATVLPVSLLYFKAANQNCSVQLNWESATETDFDRFEVEHGGGLFTRIAVVSPTGNNSLYSFMDPRPVRGINLYRLKMVDKDGQFTYSSIAAVNNNCGIQKISAWPNPTGGQLYVGGLEIGASITITDSFGQHLETAKVKGALETFNLSIYPDGIYIVKVVKADGTPGENIKIIKK